MKQYSIIKQSTHQKFYELVRNEKNTQNTVLASFSLIVDENEVILCSLGTGTKAVGLKQLNDSIFSLHSCHAEVIAKRGFQLWLYHILQREEQTKKLFEELNGKWQLKKNIKLCLYISQPPCGQAGLFQDSSIYGISAARPFSEFQKEATTIPCFDSSRLRSTPTNSKTPINQRNPSFCCSDKIMLWTVLGIQGALLNQFIFPIYIDHLIIDYRDKFSLRPSISIQKRAKIDKKEILKINNRSISKEFKIHRPKLVYGRNNYFSSSPYHPNNDYANKRINPEIDSQSYQSFSYVFVEQVGSEKINSINGLRWGVAKKDFSKINLLPCISKYHLYGQFRLLKTSNKETLNYQKQKNINIRYRAVKKRIRECFSEWSIDKSEFELFQ